MNKAELVAAVAAKTNFTKKDAELAINAFLASVQESLVKGEKVQLIGFGTFETRERNIIFVFIFIKLWNRELCSLRVTFFSKIINDNSSRVAESVELCNFIKGFSD